MTYIKVDTCSTRLGNWMFFYAAAKSAANGGAVSFVIDGHQDIECIKKYSCLWPDVEYVRGAPAGEQVMIGAFQDVKYLKRDVVGKLYKCPESIDADINSKYGELLNDDDLVSIHVRRGDYMKLPHRHPFVGEAYLRTAVQKFKVHGQKTKQNFFVFSDDIPWCKKFFSEKGFPGCKFNFAEGNSVLMDLFLMSKCRGGHICSNSSFSWWGAYIGNEECRMKNEKSLTIFPSHWYGCAIKDEGWSGMYFDGSEVIRNDYTPLQWLLAHICILKNYCGSVLRRAGMMGKKALY